MVLTPCRVRSCSPNRISTATAGPSPARLTCPARGTGARSAARTAPPGRGPPGEDSAAAASGHHSRRRRGREAGAGKPPQRRCRCSPAPRISPAGEGSDVHVQTLLMPQMLGAQRLPGFHPRAGASRHGARPVAGPEPAASVRWRQRSGIIQGQPGPGQPPAAIQADACLLKSRSSGSPAPGRPGAPADDDQAAGSAPRSPRPSLPRPGRPPRSARPARLTARPAAGGPRRHGRPVTGPVALAPQGRRRGHHFAPAGQVTRAGHRIDCGAQLGRVRMGIHLGGGDAGIAEEILGLVQGAARVQTGWTLEANACRSSSGRGGRIDACPARRGADQLVDRIQPHRRAGCVASEVMAYMVSVDGASSLPAATRRQVIRP